MERNWLWRATLAGCLCLCPPLWAVADDAWLELAGQWGGISYAVDVDGNIACLGVGPRVVVLDVSLPSEPQFLGQSPVLPHEVRALALAGRFAYVVCEDLHVIDLTDPADPEWVATGTAEPLDYLADVAVMGSYAYTINQYSTLQVFDISDPCAPGWVASCPSSGYGQALALAGNYAYVLSSYALHVIDISAPDAPFVVSSTARSYARDITVRDEYAYLTSWHQGPEFVCGLEVVDVSNPYVPLTVGFCPAAWYSHAVSVAGDYAYMTVDDTGLAVINVANPTAPFQVGTCEYGAELSLACVAVAGEFAYMTDADADHGLLVMDVQDPAAPQLVGGYHDVGRAYGVTVAGAYAYVDGRRDGLHIVDISDPAQPQRLAFRPGGGNAAVVQNIVYLAKYYDGLEIVDVSDPAAPVMLGQYATSDCALDVAVQDHFAYVADLTGGLIVVDVADPCAPAWVGGCAVGSAWAIDLSGQFAFVADSRAGLRIINVTDPSAPFEIGFCTVASPKNVQVVGPYAYMATYSDGFDIIDVSDPYHPQTIGQFTAPGANEYVAVHGNYAHLANRSRFFLVDVSIPSQPALADEFDTSGQSCGVDVSGGYAYVADDQSGLTILAVHIPADLNCDGRVDFGDINPFVLALSNPGGYSQTYPQCHLINADINGDGTVDFGDINPFVALLTGM
jgi:hypothetical protein